MSFLGINLSSTPLGYEPAYHACLQIPRPAVRGRTCGVTPEAFSPREGPAAGAPHIQASACCPPDAGSSLEAPLLVEEAGDEEEFYLHTQQVLSLYTELFSSPLLLPNFVTGLK